VGLALALAFATVAVGQETNPHFDHLGEEQDLSTTRDNGITEDGAGFVWFATGVGLSRFDGYAFRSYRNTPEECLQPTEQLRAERLHGPQGPGVGRLRQGSVALGPRRPLGYLEAGVRYKDFRNRYPSHPKSDYALFRLSQCSDRQAERPDREQTNTRLGATSYRELIINFPDSPYATESRTRLGVMRNLLAEHEYLVGHFYLKRRAWRAAKGRMDVILAAYPEYAGLDKVLYEAGVLERRMGNGGEARSLWERLQKDYPASPLVKKVPAPLATAPALVRAAGG